MSKEKRMTGASGIRQRENLDNFKLEPSADPSVKTNKVRPNDKASITNLCEQADRLRLEPKANDETKLDSKKQLESREGQVVEFDHVTFWVGNAKHSASFFMSHFGFLPYAFRGLETGSRDLACHVVKLNDTVIQFASALEPDNKQFGYFLASHGDAVKDVAFRVMNIESLLANALEAGAELVAPIETNAFGEGNRFIVKRATIKTFGDVTHTFIERNYDYQDGQFLPGYKKPSLEVRIFLTNHFI